MSSPDQEFSTEEILGFLTRLEDSDSFTRGKAREFLAKNKNKWRERICNLLDSPDANVRRIVAVSIAEIGSCDSTTLRKLSGLTMDVDEWVRYAAIYAIGTVTQNDDPTITKVILASLDDKSWHVRQAALEVYSQISHSLKDVQKITIRVLESDESAAVRSFAILQLGDIAISNESARNSLLGAKTDVDVRVRFNADQVYRELFR